MFSVYNPEVVALSQSKGLDSSEMISVGSSNYEVLAKWGEPKHEYEDLEEFQGNYGEDFETIESIQDHTSVIMIDNDRFIIQAF